MQTCGWQADQVVAGLDFTARQQLLFFNRTDDKAGEIVLSFGVKARHFGSFASNERTAVMGAAPGDSCDHIRRDQRVEFAHREVIKKKEWFRTLNGDVVNA